MSDKSIIEKLGITGSPWNGVHGEGTGVKGHSILSRKESKRICVTRKKEDALLIAAAPELLKALIEVLEMYESDGFPDVSFLYDKLFQKATGKSWKQIKELL